MNKTITCGKIDWYGNGRKINAVELELALNLKNGQYVFSCSGAIWNSCHSDWVAGGQCYDELSKFAEMSKYQELLSLWKKYSNNDLHAGTERQEAVLKKWQKEHPDVRRTYDGDCRVLKDARCHTDHGYVYGSAWLYRPIPEDDLAKIRKWLGA